MKHQASGSSDECPVCRESLMEGKLVSHCSGKQVFHHQCMLNVCCGEGPENAKCPVCRQLLFTDEADLDYLKFGIVNKKTYLSDDRYNSWEEFERSCADLDKCLAQNDTADIVCNTSFLHISRVAFGIIVDGALEEPRTSTPYHLQPARCSDLQLFIQRLAMTLNNMHGHRLRAAEIYECLQDSINAAFSLAYEEGKLRPRLTNEEIEAVNARAGNSGNEVVMRPGFAEFVGRTLSRMLMFVRLRRCECEAGVIHWHGVRVYYNPGFNDW